MSTKPAGRTARQQLDPVDHARTGVSESTPRRARRPWPRRTACRPVQPGGRGIRPQAASAPARSAPRGMRSSISGSRSPIASHVATRRSLAIATEQVPAAGSTDLLRNPAARRERRIDPLQRDDTGRRMACGPPRDDDFLDVGKALAEDLNEAQRLVLAEVMAPIVAIAWRMPSTVIGASVTTVGAPRRAPAGFAGAGRPGTSRAPRVGHEDQVGRSSATQRVVDVQAHGARTGPGSAARATTRGSAVSRDLARSVMPTRSSASPSAQTISVAAGRSETMRIVLRGRNDRPPGSGAGRQGCRGSARWPPAGALPRGRPLWGAGPSGGLSVSSIARAAPCP